MKITIQGVPEFTWSPSIHHLAVLSKLSNRHYDGTCKAASKPGPLGFIYGWTVQLDTHQKFGGGDPVQCRASFRDLDLCLKIMEGAPIGCNPSEMSLVREMQSAFNRVLSRANALYAVWKEEVA